LQVRVSKLTSTATRLLHKHYQLKNAADAALKQFQQVKATYEALNNLLNLQLPALQE
jgi:hypothetical protein